MLATMADGGIERFDDLHIDEIDDVWRPQQLWIEGALEAFRIAVQVRDRHHLPAEIELAFSLQASYQKTGIDFATQQEFAARLGWSPPSLYLFAAGTDHRRENEKAIRAGRVFGDAFVGELELNLFGALANSEHCFYLEFRQKDSSEYNRTVFLQG